VVRQLNGIVAGTAGMGWWRFLAFNAAGAALWVSAWGFGVYHFGQSLAHVVARLHGLGYVIGVIALSAIAAAIVLHGRRRRHEELGGDAPG
jgi:membrane protein DedA with SNARE-associated domain